MKTASYTLNEILPKKVTTDCDMDWFLFLISPR
jgi:hypothetical protein